MKTLKDKKKGNEFRYSNSLYYEWYVKFEDELIISMFNVEGEEVQLYTAYDYAEFSPIVEIGLRSFSQEKADRINENQNHQLMVIGSNNPQIQIDINFEIHKKPYIMRRRMFITNGVEFVYMLGTDENGSQFLMVRDKTGNTKQTYNKMKQWNEIINGN